VQNEKNEQNGHFSTKLKKAKNVIVIFLIIQNNFSMEYADILDTNENMF